MIEPLKCFHIAAAAEVMGEIPRKRFLARDPVQTSKRLGQDKPSRGGSAPVAIFKNSRISSFFIS